MKHRRSAILRVIAALGEWDSIEDAYNTVAESFEYKIYKPQKSELCRIIQN